MTIDKADITGILESAFSYVVVMAMFVYGVGKITQFDGALNTSKSVSEMTGMQLMWAFYGYSKEFTITLGVLEICGGILMLYKRTRLIGCFFLTTILINIILQDIFYEVHVGALRAAILYQLLIIIILWFNRQRLIQSLTVLIGLQSPVESKKKLLKIFISIILFAIIRVLEFYITIKW